ncbi:MAG TPA: histidine kinase [Pyrinomonadaceae bacterium]|nr:histidine kinase [Pyrinomonadaceae bacterium]
MESEVPRLAGPWSFVFNGVLAYASIVAVHQAVLHFREAQEREFRLQQAQLQALKAQLQPHFLFNTLNTAATSRSVRRARARLCASPSRTTAAASKAALTRTAVRRGISDSPTRGRGSNTCTARATASSWRASPAAA